MNDFDWTLLDRVAAGDATAEEAAAVERWAALDPARRALLDALRRPAADVTQWDANAAWAAVRRRTLDEDAHVPPAAPAATNARRGAATVRAERRWGSAPALLRAAAIVVVVGGTALLARNLLQSDARRAGEVRVVATARTESDTVRLGDGTVVILAAESRLEYPRAFGATSRAVRLTGAAWFDVATDSARPFTVAAGHAVVRVVGTQFVTRTAPAGGDGAVTVAVSEGAVAVRADNAADDAAIVIHPGQVARVAASGETSVVVTDLEPYIGWLEGRLVFDDVPLADVLAELRRWYPVEFRADEVLLARRVTARLRAGSLAQTADALALALGATHRTDNDTIIFTINR